LVSSTQLSVALAIATPAALVLRDVTASHHVRPSPTRPSSVLVAQPPATLSLAFQGKLRDKVGQGNSALTADGALDGTFQVTLEAGSGARTVTRDRKSVVEGKSGEVGGGRATEKWRSGAEKSLDGAQHNERRGHG